MYYYLLEKNGHYYVEPNLNGNYSDVKIACMMIDNTNVHGKFGREKYAQIWADYYNGKINQNKLRSLLFKN